MASTIGEDISKYCSETWTAQRKNVWGFTYCVEVIANVAAAVFCAATLASMCKFKAVWINNFANAVPYAAKLGALIFAKVNTVWAAFAVAGVGSAVVVIGLYFLGKEIQKLANA